MDSIGFSIQKTNLYEESSEKLEQPIPSQTSAVGGKFPSEQELANGFCVVRNVIREALKVLSARGLITFKTGDGAYNSISACAVGRTRLPGT